MLCLLLTNHLSCLSGVTVLYTWLEWDVMLVVLLVDKPLVFVE